MRITGIGTVFSQGRGIEALTHALEHGSQKPDWHQHPTGGVPVQIVTKETLTDKKLLKKMRRADRFSRMAVLAAVDAVTDSRLQLSGDKQNLGIILSTALGPHATTFKYLDDILEYGDDSTSPTLFSHSVHNAATSYISATIGCRGPTLTLSQFGLSFHQTLILAQAWLDEGRCDYVLAGSVDECGPAMEYIVSQKTNLAQDGQIHPFTFSDRPLAVPGEGALFMLLTRKESDINYYATIKDISTQAPGQQSIKKNDSDLADLLLLDCDGMSGSEQEYLPEARSAPLLACYTPLYGSLICNSAFSLAAGAIMLKNQKLYPCPAPCNEQDNPYDLPICQTLTNQKLTSIRCLKKSPLFKNGEILLEK